MLNDDEGEAVCQLYKLAGWQRGVKWMREDYGGKKEMSDKMDTEGW